MQALHNYLVIYALYLTRMNAVAPSKYPCPNVYTCTCQVRQLRTQTANLAALVVRADRRGTADEIELLNSDADRLPPPDVRTDVQVQVEELNRQYV